MSDFLHNLHSPLFSGMTPEEQQAALHCIGYHIGAFPKGSIIALENDNIKQVGILLSGAVDMIKEDIWGNRSLLMRIYKDDLFGETFACGTDSQSVVTFTVSQDAEILFLPFCKTMCNCANNCGHHHKVIENMVRVIADKTRELLRKVEVVSKRTIRERVLAYLSIQSQLQKSRYLELPLGRLELADYLCVDRSALTRELAKMKEDGLIDYDRNCFRLL
ncbi:MAG: Crp/Fnr family transcriptional regulator [Oscillospiraceae bacterium]|nr:Crp/Fnr family transcriptional regulator [Oscillospiraceae bacterium]